MVVQLLADMVVELLADMVLALGREQFLSILVGIVDTVHIYCYCCYYYY